MLFQGKVQRPAPTKPCAGPRRGIGPYVARKPRVKQPVKQPVKRQEKTHLTYEDFYPTGLGNYGDLPDVNKPEQEKKKNPYQGTPHWLTETPLEHRLNCKGKSRRFPAKTCQPMQPLPPQKFEPIPNPTFPYKFDNEMTKEEERCLNILNAHRRSANLPPLVYSRKLAEIIAPHNHRCALRETGVGHEGFKERARQIPRMKKAGENVAMVKTRFDYIDVLTRRLMESEHHRANILGDYNKVGMAFEMNDKGEWFGSQLFAKV